MRPHIASYLAVGIVLLLQASSQDVPIPELQDIRAQVASNFESIHNIRVTVDVNLPYAPPRSNAKPQYVRHVWATKSGGYLRFENSSVTTLGEDPQGTTEIIACNPNQARGLYNFDKAGMPTQGQVFDMSLETSQRAFNYDPTYLAEFGRAAGVNVNGKSIVEWLNTTDVRVSGMEQVSNFRCVVIEVPRISERPNSSDTRIERFYLSLQHNMAIMRIEGEVNGVVKLQSTVSELKEFSEGIWLPVRGEVDPIERIGTDGLPLVSREWVVRSVEVNSEIPDEYFELNFPEGLPVFDQRFNTHFRQGMGPVIAKEDLAALHDATVPGAKSLPEQTTLDIQSPQGILPLRSQVKEIGKEYGGLRTSLNLGRIAVLIGTLVLMILVGLRFRTWWTTRYLQDADKESLRK